jgi:hypothetical protein
LWNARRPDIVSKKVDERQFLSALIDKVHHRLTDNPVIAVQLFAPWVVDDVERPISNACEELVRKAVRQCAPRVVRILRQALEYVEISIRKIVGIVQELEVLDSQP